jgi:hypothetical protein
MPVEVFGQRDPVLRREAIARTYTHDVAFTDHAGSIVGLAAVEDRVQQLLQDAPAAFAFAPDGPIYVGEDTARWPGAWDPQTVSQSHVVSTSRPSKAVASARFGRCSPVPGLVTSPGRHVPHFGKAPTHTSPIRASDTLALEQQQQRRACLEAPLLGDSGPAASGRLPPYPREGGKSAPRWRCSRHLQSRSIVTDDSPPRRGRPGAPFHASSSSRCQRGAWRSRSISPPNRLMVARPRPTISMVSPGLHSLIASVSRLSSRRSCKNAAMPRTAGIHSSITR